MAAIWSRPPCVNSLDCQKVVILTAFSSLAVPEIVILTSSGATSEEKVVNVTTFWFQCTYVLIACEMSSWAEEVSVPQLEVRPCRHEFWMESSSLDPHCMLLDRWMALQWRHMSAMASQITSNLFVQQLVQANGKEYIKAPHHLYFLGNPSVTGDRRNSLTNPVMQKSFRVMMSMV